MRVLHAGIRDGAVRRLHSRTARDLRRPSWMMLAGNLCRCTGYRPIVDGGAADCAVRRRPTACRDGPENAPPRSTQSPADADIFLGGEDDFFAAPAILIDALAALYPEATPTRTLVAARPMSGLWVTKQLRDSDTRSSGLDASKWLDTIDEAADGAHVRRDHLAERRAAEPRRDPSRSRRVDAPLRHRAGPQCRHRRRQHRQRLADRRHCRRR